MAGQPSSSHREREHGDRTERHRSDRERSSHHHHRTISSTTLLLVLSLVLAVLAVMLSLPSQAANAAAAGGGAATATDPAANGVWGYLTPKRSQALVAREGQVAMRESEVARREAELLAGAPGGVIPPSASPILCPICPSVVETVHAPVQTIIKEVVTQTDVAPAGWAGVRADEILDRELRIAERERDIGKREDSVNRREHDASRREGWIMEQLIVLGNGDPQTVIDDEYVYRDEPVGGRRRAKVPVIAETYYEPEIQTVTETLPPRTVTVPAPANTRLAAQPIPDASSHSATASTPRTTSVEIITEEDIIEDDGPRTRTVGRNARQPTRRPAGWFGGW